MNNIQERHQKIIDEKKNAFLTKQVTQQQKFAESKEKAIQEKEEKVQIESEKRLKKYASFVNLIK